MTYQPPNSFADYPHGPPSPLWSQQEWVRMWLKLDVLVQELLLKHGPGETISAVAALAAEHGDPLGIALCGVLEVIDPGHCARAREGNA